MLFEFYHIKGCIHYDRWTAYEKYKPAKMGCLLHTKQGIHKYDSSKHFQIQETVHLYVNAYRFNH